MREENEYGTMLTTVGASDRYMNVCCILKLLISNILIKYWGRNRAIEGTMLEILINRNSPKTKAAGKHTGHPGDN